MLNGSKRFITNAGEAGTYIVTARTGDRDDGSAEISAFIIEADTPGFSSAGSRRSLACTPATPASCFSRTPKIPADQMLGAKGEGWKIFLKTLDGGRISIGAMAVGLSQAALDASVVYARERKQFGKPIGSFQGVAFMIADMATEIEAARSMVWRAAWLKDQGAGLQHGGRPGQAVCIGSVTTRDQHGRPGARWLRLR